MRNKVSMDAPALRALMGDAFNREEYEQGRHDLQKLYTDRPDEWKAEIEQAKNILSNGSYINTPGPSYWIGCLAEADFI